MQQNKKMSVLDRTFLVFLAVLMYVLGFPRIVIGAIIVSLLILEYLFVLENYHVNEYYPQGRYLRC
jgi:hypothetical protein